MNVAMHQKEYLIRHLNKSFTRDDARHGQGPVGVVQMSPVILFDEDGQGLGPACLVVPHVIVLLPLAGCGSSPSSCRSVRDCGTSCIDGGCC